MRLILGWLLGCAAISLCACNYGAVESGSLLAKGIKLYETKNPDKAMAVFTQALESNPNNADALYHMALIDMDYRDFAQAQAKLNSAIGIAPEMPLYRYTLGTAHKGHGEKLAESGQFDESIGEYSACARAMDQAVQADPFYTEAWIEKARCCVKSGSYQAAVEAYQKAIGSNPVYKSELGTTVHYQELGVLYAQFGFYEEAVAVLNNGMLNNPGDAAVEMALGDVLRSMNRLDESLAHYEFAAKSVSLNKESQLRALPAMYGAGMVLYQMARQADKDGKQRQAHGLYASAREWLMKFIDSAVTEDEKLRRSGAVLHVKHIDGILMDEEI